MQNFQVIEVNTPSLFMQFLKFPWQIYKSDPLWVPPLLSDREFLLSEKKNPFWKHAEKKLFLLKRDGKYVGRIAGIVDNNFVEFHNEKTGFFGFFECIDDTVVAGKLLALAEEWVKSKGMTKVIGPVSPSSNDEIGFLLEGWDSSARLMMMYNPKYYLDLVEKCGYTKAKDLYAWMMQVKDGPQEKLAKFAERVQKREPGIEVRDVDLTDFDAEVERVVQIYNNAWEKNWGFVPWTREEFESTAKQLKPLFVPEPTAIALVNGEPVGILLVAPDYNEVFKRMNGRLGPIGLAKFLWYSRKIKGLRLLIMGVVKKYRNRGIEGLMYYHSLIGAKKKGYIDCEFSWVLEDNTLTNRAAEFMGGKLYKKYRVFEKVVG
ncbi:MAG: hypothetical protein WC955_11470 [Elusimicrobiota bacterium]